MNTTYFFPSRIIAAISASLLWSGQIYLNAASDVSISTAVTSGGSFAGPNPNVFTPTAASAVANNGTIQTSLNGGNAVTVNTASAAGGNGDLTVTSAIAKTAGASSTLTFNAVRDLIINAAVSSSTGAMPLVLNAGRNMSNAQALTSNGGNITLSPVQTFTVGAAVNAGAGQVAIQSGSVESSSDQNITGSSVVVASSAALRLRGTIAGPLTVGGTVSPAPAGTTETLQVNGTITLQGTAATVVDLGGTSAGSSYDSISATGAVVVDGALQVNLVNNFHDTISGSSVFTVIQGSSITGTFAGYPDGSRFTLANDFGSLRVNYTATAVTLDDWQPVMVDLTWDPGMAEGGTQIFSNTNTRAGRHYFRVVTQGTDIGAWRTRLTVASGDAALYLSKTNLPTTGSSQFSSVQTGSDGFVLRDDQFAAAEEWFILVNADAGAQWSLFSGRAYVHELGALPFTDANTNSQYDIGEAVSAQTAPASPMPPEGIRFYKSIVPTGTPAWSLWLNGSTRDIALETTKVPFHSSTSYYTRKQSGQMLVVPTVLGTGSSTYFLSVVAPKGESIGLDSRIQTVTDIDFNSTTSSVAVAAAPYRVYRVQVPIDQLAWDVSTTALAGDPNVCVRQNDVPGEWDNIAMSEAAGNTTDSITLVPNFLTNGTWFITVYGTGSYTFTLKSGDPVITPLSFTDNKTNDQTTRAGWRYYALTDIPAQVGSLGWELLLSNQVPGTQIAIRRNKVPSRWQYRSNGSASVNDTFSQYMDYEGTDGFLQRPGHQADVWYVGIFTPQQPLGAFVLDVHPIVPATVGFTNSNTAVTGLQPGRWRFQRIDVPVGVLGWDLRVKNVTGGAPVLIVRRDLLPDSTSGNWGNFESYPDWASGSSIRGRIDWTGRDYDVYETSQRPGERLLLAMGRPLEPGTYYVGVYNSAASGNAAYTLESRGIGTGQPITVANLNYTAGSNAIISNLVPREAAYYKVTIPANTPSWEFTLAPSEGEMMMAIRRGAVPDFQALYYGDVQHDVGTGGSREIEVQKTGAERFVMLPYDDSDYITAGDYYIAAISEGTSPPNTYTIGTGTSSGVLTSLGGFSVTSLGAASAGGITQPVSLFAGQVKAYTFTVPVGTASLEVRLDNRVGNPEVSLISGARTPQGSSGTADYGRHGGQTSGVSGGTGAIRDDNLLTVANPLPGTYSVTVRAAYHNPANDYADASANLVITANSPVPLTFNGGTSSVTGQLATAWRYFTVTVPAGVNGWDVRLKNITSGAPQMVVRRDTLPSTTGTGPWPYPYANTNWPTDYQWRGGIDWTARYYDIGAPTYAQPGERLVAGMGRPLEPGTYYVGVYNADSSPNAAYTVESRGIGTGQVLPVTNLNYAAGSNATVTNLQPREAAYFKVTIPAGTPSWEFTLAPTVGEMMAVVRRGTVPDMNADASDDLQSDSWSREVEIQRTGPERFVLLPRNDETTLVADDYYIAVISEGVDPVDSVIGTGNTSGVLTSHGPLTAFNFGTASLSGLIQPVSLLAAQVKAYTFTVPPGTSSLEVRLDNRVGNPWFSLVSGTAIPQPGNLSNGSFNYGFNGGQYSAPVGGTARAHDGNLITVANPPAGTFSLTVRADKLEFSPYPFVDASADLVVVANAPVPLAFDGGTSAITGQAATAWRFFSVTVPAGVNGWDIRVKNVTGGTPLLAVRRDQLPVATNTSPWANPSSSNNWPTGYTIGGGVDWTGRNYDTYAPTYDQAPERLILPMGRPLEPGTYFIGVYNNHASEGTSYTVESRGIGAGQTLPVTNLSPAAGNSATITNLPAREAAYFRVTIPPNTPSWECTLAPSAGDMMLAMGRDAIPDFEAYYGTDVQYSGGDHQTEAQKAGPERYLLLPKNDEDFIVPGDYYLAVISEGVNPPNPQTIGTGNSSGVLTSNGPLVQANLGAASIPGIMQSITLAGAQVKAYTFTVPVGTHALEVRLDNRVGDPWLQLISGTRLPIPGSTSSYTDYAYNGGQFSAPSGGVSHKRSDNIITITNPPSGTYSITLRADRLNDGTFPDASADLVIRQLQRLPLNYDASQNGNGFSHTDMRQLLDLQKTFYEVPVPVTLGGNPVLGWLIKINHQQGDTTFKVFKTWGENSAADVIITGNTALFVPPFLTPGDTWFVEVQGNGLTNYTITSLPITLERPVYAMPTGHNNTFGDSGNDSGGAPLPGDRGVDIGQDDWHFFAIDVPEGNDGLLRTELQAINGNPNLYIREDGVPTTDHSTNGNFGSSLIDRSLASTSTEYGNWVPLDGRYEKQLPTGRWYLGVKASGGTNARYRLILSTGQVTDLALSGGSVTNQNLVGRDWRYYRFSVPLDAPNSWNLTFSQQVGDVNMWLRDIVPPGNNDDGLESSGGSTGLRTWHSDNKNQGPYSISGHDAAGTYNFNTPPLRPGHTYYVGFHAENDATFSFSSATSGTIGTLPVLDFYTGTVNTNVPASSSLLYRIPAPPEGTRMKWSATNPSTIECRIEQGTLPGTTGSQHFISSNANAIFNQSLTANFWPWLPNQNYYLRVTNTSGSPQALVLTMNGKNIATEDEDNDGLPDAWEIQYFTNINSNSGNGDPDGDGVTNTVEFTDGTIPNNVTSAKYFLTFAPYNGTAGKAPDQPKYDRGSVVTLTDTPVAGHTFVGWQRVGDYADDFAVKITGTVAIPASGIYTFGTNAADGLRLKVNNVTVITDDSTHSLLDRFGEITLAAGMYPIELTAFEYFNSEALELFAAAGSHASFNSNFKLLGDMANGGLVVQTISGVSTVAGLTVQQIVAVGTGNITHLPQMDELLAGTRAKRAEATVIAQSINYIGSGSTQGNFASSANFPLQQPAPANPYALGMFGDYTVAALNSIPFADAVDNSVLSFTPAGDAQWLGELSAQAFDTVDHAGSGPISHSQNSSFSTTIVGPGTFTFRWKVSCEASNDRLQFLVNGGFYQEISGEQPYALVTFNATSGPQTLTWRYIKNSAVSSGSDRGWVDQIAFAQTRYTLTVTPPSGGTVDLNPLQSDYAYGTVVTLTAIPTPGNTFSNWSGAVTGGTNPTNVTMDANKTVTASFGLSLPTALDTPGRTYTFGGNGNWYGQTTTTHDGVDAGQSGPIGFSQETWFETTVTGPGDLSFWWKVSSEGGYDWLEFYVDGALQSGRISGTVDWEQKAYTLGAGNHVLRWRYSTDYALPVGSDCGWVDQLVWTPAAGGVAAWQSTYFTPAEIADPQFGGPNADPNKDGISNLLAYALDLPPLGPGGSLTGILGASMSAAGPTGHLILSLSVPDPLPAGITFIIEVSDTLTANSWTTVSTATSTAAWSGSGAVTQDSPSGGYRNVHVHDIVNQGTSPQRFMRLRVTMP